MATKVIVCPECESPLVPGRYSCSSCGALLASVASLSRSFTRPAPVVVESGPAEPIDEDAPLEASSRPDGAEAVGVEAADAVDVELGWGEPDASPSVAVNLPPAPAASPAEVDAPEAVAAATAVAAPAAPTWPESPTWPTQQPAQPQPAWPSAPAWPTQQPAQPQPAWPTQQPAEPQPAWPEQSDWRVPPPWPANGVPVAPEPPERTPAGAYLPPSAVLPPGDALPIAGEAATAAPTPRRALAERFALGEGDGPLGLPANAPGRTVAFGAAIAGFGFLLPWAEIVIGSGSVGSFFDQWGLAGPGNYLVFLMLFGVGALAVAHERFPITVSTGLPALVLGSILLGLVFPYVMGPFHEAIGVYVVAVGAIVMIVGGLLARAAARHATEDARV